MMPKFSRHTFSENSPKTGRKIACDGPDFNDLAVFRHKRHTLPKIGKFVTAENAHVFKVLQIFRHKCDGFKKGPSHVTPCVTKWNQTSDIKQEKAVTLFTKVGSAHTPCVTLSRL